MRTITYQDLLSKYTSHRGVDTLLDHEKVDFSNACNLRCTMCSPHRSTGWYKDIKVIEDNLTQEEVSRVVFNPKNREYGLPISFIDDNLDVILKTELIDAKGEAKSADLTGASKKVGYLLNKNVHKFSALPINSKSTRFI